MTLDNKDLVLDLVEWIGNAPKPYEEVMDAWRTSCPRLQIWEDAVDHGLLARYDGKPTGQMVKVTEKGMRFLEDNNRSS
ncbi:MAG: hypothetical protein ACR2Q4_07395 [Geminicoccaceae bacterium]